MIARMGWALIGKYLGLVVGVAFSSIPQTAKAHPHVLPTIQLEVGFSAEGELTSVRQIWTYDLMYSTFVARDIDVNNDGVLSEQEIENFANKQINLLLEQSYFTKVTVKDAPVVLGTFLSSGARRLEDGRIEITFAPSLSGPSVINGVLAIEVFDPSFFAYFTMADGGVRLAGAPAGCTHTVSGPQPIDLKNTHSVPALFWQALDGSKYAASQFANRIIITCP